jgi:hypothetical protein
MDLAHIKKCIDLTDLDVVTAVASREDTRALLEHLSARSAPNSGGAKILLVLARMATTAACEWLDGTLRIEIVGDEDVSVLEVLSELGGGMRERVFPPLPLRVPLAEFTRAIERVPHLVKPLSVRSAMPTRVILTATEEVRRASGAMEPVKISDDSIVMSSRRPPPPTSAPPEKPPPPQKPVPPPLPKKTSGSR